MRRLAAAFVLACAAGLAGAAEPAVDDPPDPAADGAARTAAVQAVLDDFAQHGFGRAKDALRRLREAGPLPETAPQHLRQRYFATIAQEAGVLEETAAQRAALDALQAMATREGCAPCATELVLLPLNQAIDEGNVPRVRELQAQLAARPPAVAWRDRFNAALTNARALERLSDAAAGLEAALQAARLAAEAGSAVDQLASLEQLASINMLRRDFRQALRDLDEALAQARALGNPNFIATQLINQGYVHAMLKDRPRQFAALQEALELARGTPALPDAELVVLNNLSNYYNGDPQGHGRAYQYALQGERLARKLGDRVTLAFTRTNRGVAMVYLGQVDGGLALAREGVATVRGMGLQLETAELLEQLSIAYEAAGRDADAIAALRERLLLLDQTAQRENDQAAQELQERFDAERKALEIERLSVQEQRSAAEAETRSLRRRVWAVGALALVLAGVLIGRGILQVRRRSQRLQTTNARLDAEASHDALTGAFNRGHAERWLAAPPAATVGLALLDVDHFKRINDTHGHAAGDAVLQAVAQRLQDGLRGSDVLVRWGGEEFLLLLPGCDAAALQGPVGRALARLGQAPVPLPAGEPLRVTASAGACVWPAHPGQTWQQAVHLADQALYLAKQGGRDRGTCVVFVTADVAQDAARLARLDTALPQAVAAGDAVLAEVPGSGRPAA
jgi:diguanylate cyclase (GGDEF)-like protein